MRIRHIEIFHAVMRAGTVQGAADMLHITQPAATRLLQQAEQNLGVALFQRTRGRMVPTEEALQLFPEVEQLYQWLQRVRRVAGNVAQGIGTQLRLLCVPSLSMERLPRALGRWHERHPKGQVSLQTLHSSQIGESIALREAHLGVAFEPSPHPAVISEVIATGRLVCVGEALPAGESMPLAELGTRQMVDLHHADPLGRLLHAALRAHAVTPDARAVVQSYHAAIELAAQGFGVAVVDSYTAAHAQHLPRLRVLPLAPVVPVPIYVLRPRDMPSSAAAIDLVEKLAEELRD